MQNWGHLFFDCVFAVNANIVNFSEDPDLAILYLYTKFSLDRRTSNGGLSSDMRNWKHIQTESDILPIAYSVRV